MCMWTSCWLLPIKRAPKMKQTKPHTAVQRTLNRGKLKFGKIQIFFVHLRWLMSRIVFTCACSNLSSWSGNVFSDGHFFWISSILFPNDLCHSALVLSSRLDSFNRSAVSSYAFMESLNFFKFTSDLAFRSKSLYLRWSGYPWLRDSSISFTHEQYCFVWNNTADLKTKEF